MSAGVEVDRSRVAARRTGALVGDAVVAGGGVDCTAAAPAVVRGVRAMSVAGR
jgi:hypothetical protein